ncbi:multidrug MFS transporter [Levilactobacillus bambusae]|uniref:Multidrug MFS transporter n=2 Tax=Levilactobacillus bambusae TaxID=2024736 RepID=A0A2V1MXW9_9LACO|nr:sugar transferase [Levilactobacillus bambusae]PWF99883.1 multidrug MFS transporter [Levilactobacillus bambusae]
MNKDKSFYNGAKRCVDIFFSTFALICLSPVFLAVSIAYSISKEDHGSIFYQQTRMGLHGQTFKILKFRSMVVDADKKLEANPVLYQKYIRNNFKLPADEDPRITKLGKWLRKTSLDEIPQFINILRGEMSLVGPRPVVADELKQYDDVEKLLSVKPGAMGLWQARGRSEIGYPERANIEMEYVDNRGLFFDFKVIIMNLINIFIQRGAY